MTDLRQLSADHARRFLVRRQLLDPPRSLPAEPASVLRVIDRIGSLQFDPLEVPGARNHDLVLNARIDGYRREWADQLLYGPLGERQLVELYNKMLSIVPMRELPYYRMAWTRAAARALDEAEIDQVVGTVAGDDTVFVATPGGAAARRLERRLRAALSSPRAAERVHA